MSHQEKAPGEDLGHAGDIIVFWLTWECIRIPLKKLKEVVRERKV